MAASLPFNVSGLMQRSETRLRDNKVPFLIMALGAVIAITGFSR